jgi:hypothetical protein
LICKQGSSRSLTFSSSHSKEIYASSNVEFIREEGDVIEILRGGRRQ